jgi:PelA/Pel-15E family pectate lyase
MKPLCLVRFPTLFTRTGLEALALALGAIVLLQVGASIAQGAETQLTFRNDSVLQQPAEWYSSAEARALADSVIQYQSPEGGWPKSTDMVTPPPSPDFFTRPDSIARANTIDNDATTVPMHFLARVRAATGDTRYRVSLERGLDYLLAAQYPNGGWPQYFPLRDGYYSRITFNDEAMINVMNLLQEAAVGREPWSFVDEKRRERAAVAIDRGVACILRMQIRQLGHLTAWCAQHDEHTLEPAWARAYEPPSLSGEETVGIVRFLMTIERPSAEVIAAIEGAVAWLRAVAIRGVEYRRSVAEDGERDSRVWADPTAGPLWARFYSLETNLPIFLGRDSEIRHALAEIERERRGGYDYYGTWARSLLDQEYPRWRAFLGSTEGHVAAPIDPTPP